MNCNLSSQSGFLAQDSDLRKRPMKSYTHSRQRNNLIMKMSKKILPIILFAVTVAIANGLTTWYGLVPVGFGLVATAGTYSAGLGLGLRDWCQETSGHRGAIIAIILGTILSAVVASGRIAVASALAFFFSEGFDLIVYTSLRKFNRYWAIFASNTVGSVIDTILFLSVAGFIINGNVFWGQMIGKGWMTLLAILALKLWKSQSKAKATEAIA